MGPTGATGPAGPQGPGGFNLSGQRLKVRYLAGQDGSQQFFGWHDSMRNEQCSFFDIMNDGQYRCLPSFAGVAPFAFSDPACTQIAIQFGSNVFYAIDLQAGKIYERGPQALTIYIVNASMCEPVGMVSGFYGLGSEVPVTDFVSAAEMIN
jgi:hypothetical protein